MDADFKASYVTTEMHEAELATFSNLNSWNFMKIDYHIVTTNRYFKITLFLL